MATRWGRTLRGSVTAVIAVFLAAVSHAAGGSAAPGSVGVAVALAFAIVICIALAGAKLSLFRLTVSVALSQLLFHFLFSLGGVSGTVAPTVAEQHHGSSGLTTAALLIPALPASNATPTLLGATAHDGHGDGWMLLAHAVAAVVTIAALHRGEAAVRAIMRLAASPFYAAVRASTQRTPWYGGAARIRIVATRDFIPVAATAVLSSLRHRGPPETAAAR